MKRIALFLVAVLCSASLTFGQGQTTAEKDSVKKLWIKMILAARNPDSVINSYRMAIPNATITERGELYRKIGETYYRYIGPYKFNRDSSLYYFHKAVETDAANSKAYINIADYWSGLDNKDSAMSYYFTSTRLFPGYAEGYRGIIMQYKKYRQPDSAIYFSRILYQFHPDNSFALFELANWYDNRRDTVQAMDHYRQLLAVSNSKDYARERLALLTMAQSKTDTLPLYYLTSMVNDWPSGWRNYFHIACYYGNRGETEKSIEFLDKAMQRGMRNKEQLYAEPFLATVRDTDAFKALMGKYFV